MEKIKAADPVIWTFGAWVLFVPVQMQYLFDKLFAQGYEFNGVIAGETFTGSGQTLYTRWGDWFGWLMVVVLAVMVGMIGWKS